LEAGTALDPTWAPPRLRQHRRPHGKGAGPGWRRVRPLWRLGTVAARDPRHARLGPL